jgi:F0F1-type ATP synthase membrane subunit c/vacuolar-type H+-ATPase subunit K
MTTKAHERPTARRRVRAVTAGLLALNAVVVCAAAIATLLVWTAPPSRAAPPERVLPQQEQAAAGAGGQQAPGVSLGVALGAALATGLAAIGAGIGVGIAGAAAIGAITEKPEVLGRTLIFVGLAEGIAIYGLIISFMLLTGGFGGGG